MLIFKEPDKVPYTNEFTYDLTILSIVDKNFSVSELQIKQPEDVGMKKIEFKAGESVFVGNCLESIELKDVTMTQAELETIKMKEIEINKANTQKLINFNIPINPEKAVEPGTIPVIHDKKLKSITFSSTSVLFKLPGKRYSLDNISTWTLELNVDEFSLHSSNGIDKTYKVIKIGYDEEMRMQKFTLGDENNVETHTLLIAWSTNSNQYSLLLNSIDNSEDFQFQDVQTTTKQFQ
jgi:hypothetical protein